jgi:hypothetical protein
MASGESTVLLLKHVVDELLTRTWLPQPAPESWNFDMIEPWLQ